MNPDSIIPSCHYLVSQLGRTIDPSVYPGEPIPLRPIVEGLPADDPVRTLALTVMDMGERAEDQFAWEQILGLFAQDYLFRSGARSKGVVVLDHALIAGSLLPLALTEVACDYHADALLVDEPIPQLNLRYLLQLLLRQNRPQEGEPAPTIPDLPPRLVRRP